mmetsp:Transcript_5293/g.13325  ORF Transcript_5293/g.13325 Transcript_5293/m.13325 type:complete len:110 (-) Transcript_5293:73-402(-)
MEGTEVDEGQVYNPENIARNKMQVFSCRILVSLVLGAACGVLGVTGTAGLLAYIVVAEVLLGALLLARCNGNHSAYFRDLFVLLKEGIFQGLLSFVLSWVLLFNFVYIY